MTTTSVEDFLAAGGAPAAKFPSIGTTIKGIVESSVVSQQTDISTGKPKCWDDGNPRMQIVITLATDERDVAIDNDDGHRRLFVKGQMLTALKDALRTAGVTAPEVGATLAVQYREDGEQKTAGFSAPKLYGAQYKSAAASVVSIDELI
jgi:hypothetical protein